MSSPGAETEPAPDAGGSAASAPDDAAPDGFDGAAPATGELERLAFEPRYEWSFDAPAPRRRIAPWALGCAVIALIASLFAGWGAPLGVIGIVLAILALRRRAESRATAVWALVLAAVSVVYSAGWLVYAASQGGLFD